jgi:DNA-binding transcriptional regulator/RsmH inhibitor MraZ
VTIHRLSPKNQVTIPREARVFTASEKVEHLRAKRHAVRHHLGGEIYHIVVLMSEGELKAREAKIHDDSKLSDDQKFHYVTKLNDSMRMLALDAQNRVVLPGDFVAHLGVTDNRDLKFVCTNTVIQLWNPEHFQRFVGADDDGTFDAVLANILR